jgi:hypothetical protein
MQAYDWRFLRVELMENGFGQFADSMSALLTNRRLIFSFDNLFTHRYNSDKAQAFCLGNRRSSFSVLKLAREPNRSIELISRFSQLD